jgi:hypothetical protein
MIRCSKKTTPRLFQNGEMGGTKKSRPAPAAQSNFPIEAGVRSKFVLARREPILKGDV